MSEILNHAVNITPANTALVPPIKRITVGASGNVVIRPWGNSPNNPNGAGSNTAVTYVATAGMKIDVKCDMVLSTSTATSIVGEW